MVVILVTLRSFYNPHKNKVFKKCNADTNIEHQICIQSLDWLHSQCFVHYPLYSNMMNIFLVLLYQNFQL